jgi:hypothetical protein
MSDGAIRTAAARKIRLMRVDVEHKLYDGHAVRVIHVPDPMEVRDCHTFSYAERRGRFGNTLPDGATAAEKRAFELFEALKNVPGVDEIRPAPHAIEIHFGRVHNPDKAMPGILKTVFQHLRYKHVQLSFWSGGYAEELMRIDPPFRLQVDDVKIEPLPEAELPATNNALYLRLYANCKYFTVPVVGPLDEELALQFAKPGFAVIVSGVSWDPATAG